MAPPPLSVDVEAQKHDFINEQNRISEERVQREGHPLHVVDPALRLPIEYRTLSIHVDTSTPFEKEEAGEKRKAAVKGASIVLVGTISDASWILFHRNCRLGLAQDLCGRSSLPSICLSQHWSGEGASSASSSLEWQECHFPA